MIYICVKYIWISDGQRCTVYIIAIAILHKYLKQKLDKFYSRWPIFKPFIIHTKLSEEFLIKCFKIPLMKRAISI